MDEPGPLNVGLVEDLRNAIRQNREKTEQLEHKYAELSSKMRRLSHSNPLGEVGNPNRASPDNSWETLRPEQVPDVGWNLPSNSDEIYALGNDLQEIRPQLVDIQDIHNLEMVLHILSLGEEIPQTTRHYAYNMGRLLRAAFREGWNSAADQSRQFSRHLHLQVNVPPTEINPQDVGLDLGLGVAPEGSRPSHVPVASPRPLSNLPVTSSIHALEGLGLPSVVATVTTPGPTKTTSSFETPPAVSVESDKAEPTTDSPKLITAMTSELYAEIRMLLDFFRRQIELLALHPSPETWHAYRQVKSVVHEETTSESRDVDSNFVRGVNSILLVVRESCGVSTRFRELECIKSIGTWLEINLPRISQAKTEAATVAPKRKSHDNETESTPSMPTAGKVARSIDFGGDISQEKHCLSSTAPTSTGFKFMGYIYAPSTSTAESNFPAIGLISAPSNVISDASPSPTCRIAPNRAISVGNNNIAISKRTGLNNTAGTSLAGSRKQPLTKVQANKAGKSINGVIHCNCGLPAKQLSTKKMGPNTGRPFLRCYFPREDKNQCKFFHWCDEPFLQPPKKCSVCSTEGHNKKNCPDNQQTDGAACNFTRFLTY